MSITPETGDPIDLQTASEWCAAYRQENPRQIKAHGFGRNILEDILTQPDCVGMRMYQAINDSGERTLILVGVNGAGEDMVSGILADFSEPCPTSCSTNASPLNQ